MKKKYPKKLTPSPIVEAVIELRFEIDENLPSGILLGLIFEKFSEKYPNFAKLPVFQIPEELRKKDPNLKFKPLHKFSNDDFLLQVGDNVVSLVNVENTKDPHSNYVGWSNFFEEAKEILNELKGFNLVQNYKRIGIRYIDFFELDIFSKSNVKVLHGNTPLQNAVIKSDILEGTFFKTLQMSNQTTNNKNGATKNGSVVDIDAYIEKEKFDDTQIEKLLEIGHKECKELFFDVLGDDLINNYNPKY